MASNVGGYLSPHCSMSIGSVTLQQAHDGHLAHAASSDVLALGFVLKPRLAADVGLIDFDMAGELVAISGLHDQANALEHEPSRFLRHTNGARDFVGADAILGVGQQ